MDVRKIGGGFFIEDDCYDYLGCRDGFLYVDGAPLKDLVNLDELSCYGYVGVNGELHLREVWKEDEKDFLEIDDNMYVVEMDARKEWIGKNLIELELRKKFRMNVIAVKEKGHKWCFGDPKDIIKENETLLIALEKKELSKWK